jgi:hypothetical protein
LTGLNEADRIGLQLALSLVGTLNNAPPAESAGIIGRVIMKRVILAGLSAILIFGANAWAKGAPAGGQNARPTAQASANAGQALGAGFGPGYGRGMGGGLGLAFGPNGASIVQVLANVTGQQPAAVLASLRGGMTFTQVAESAGRSRQQLVDAVLAERKPIVEQAVVAGRLTQAQADQLMAWMKPHVEATVDTAWQQAGAGRGFGRGAGFGRGGGGYGRGMCPWATAAPAAK